VPAVFPLARLLERLECRALAGPGAEDRLKPALQPRPYPFWNRLRGGPMSAARIRSAALVLAPALVLALAGCMPTSSENKDADDSSACPSCAAARDASPTETPAASSEDCCCCESDSEKPVVRTAARPIVIDLQAVKYGKLGEAIRAHRGKVVV